MEGPTLQGNSGTYSDLLIEYGTSLSLSLLFLREFSSTLISRISTAFSIFEVRAYYTAVQWFDSVGYGHY